jgi:hypothetical protein
MDGLASAAPGYMLFMYLFTWAEFTSVLNSSSVKVETR